MVSVNIESSKLLLAPLLCEQENLERILENKSKSTWMRSAADLVSAGVFCIEARGEKGQGTNVCRWNAAQKLQTRRRLRFHFDFIKKKKYFK